jgi:hypothetical protein
VTLINLISSPGFFGAIHLSPPRNVPSLQAPPLQVYDQPIVVGRVSGEEDDPGPQPENRIVEIATGNIVAIKEAGLELLFLLFILFSIPFFIQPQINSTPLIILRA